MQSWGTTELGIAATVCSVGAVNGPAGWIVSNRIIAARGEAVCSSASLQLGGLGSLLLLGGSPRDAFGLAPRWRSLDVGKSGAGVGAFAVALPPKGPEGHRG